MNRVFVYGTLKRGEPNHHWFGKATDGICKFISEAQTIKKYPLIIATKYNIPFLLHRPGNMYINNFIMSFWHFFWRTGEGHHVCGELYEVCDKTLQFLDELEDHPNFYVRELEQLFLNGDKSNVTEGWVYLLKTYKPSLLENPMLENYSSSGSHGLRYMERYNRDVNYDYKSEVFLNKME